MSAASDKVLICTSAGCDVTLTEAAHLSAHETTQPKKMTLDLGFDCNSKDQTPTPTRFIRNCEEVGLFQDLQNVNPFEETFRKAVELAESGNIHVPEVSNNDDTLHTPHIITQILEQENDNFNAKSTCVGAALEFNANNITTSLENEVLKLNENDKTADNNSSTAKITKNVISTFQIVDMTNELGISKSGSKTLVENSAKLINANAKMTIKEKLKIKLGNNSENNSDAILIAPLKVDVARKLNSVGTVIFKTTKRNGNLIVPSKRPSKPAPISQNAKKTNQMGNSQQNTSKNQTDDSKERQRAINRESQYRSRQRKKQWMNNVEQRIKLLTEDNKRLLQENQNLKKQLIICNTIISYHKNCNLSGDKNAMKELQSLIDKTRNDMVNKSVTVNKNGQKIKPILPNLHKTSNKNVQTINNQPSSPQTVVLDKRPIIFMTSMT